MKKISFYIILLIIVVNLFLPTSFILDNKIKIIKKTVSADENWYYVVTFYKPTKNDITHDGFKTQDSCNTNRTLYLNNPNIKAILNLDDPDPLNRGGAVTSCTKKANSPTPVSPQNNNLVPSSYTFLAPLTEETTIETSNVGNYFNWIFKLAIAICAGLAVIMIIIGGIQWMGDESIFGKTEAKSKITGAILGLLIALAAYALLNTIDPALTGSGGVKIRQVTAEIGGDTNEPLTNNQLPSGIICEGGRSNIPNIVKSFDGKMTYKMGAKGVPGPDNTIMFDCSGFVNRVLKCAGQPFINSGTADIFKNAEKVTSISGTKVNGKELGIGDLVGWMPNELPKYKNYGHVMIYIGGGQVQIADSHSTKKTGAALGIFPITKYKDDIKYIKRLSDTSGSNSTDNIPNPKIISDKGVIEFKNNKGLSINLNKWESGVKNLRIFDENNTQIKIYEIKINNAYINIEDILTNTEKKYFISIKNETSKENIMSGNIFMKK